MSDGVACCMVTLPGEEHGALGGDTEACWTVTELMKDAK